ncbi:hypothetical protein F4818DRAFT_443481 [Hypoxylon cercidicola]|nr:hypothetical protein F4818DRAFT_443481 [Hypoxylon cercidicola]
MESLDEIPESPHDEREQAPTTSRKSNKKRQSKITSSAPRPHSPSADSFAPMSEDQVEDPSSDVDVPQSQWASINGTAPRKHSRKLTKKEKKRRKLAQLQGSSEIGASEIGASPDLGASTSKKRKNTETNGRSQKKSKHAHNANATADAFSNFGSLAESLYKERKQKGKIANQRPASHDSSDRDSSDHDPEANIVSQDAEGSEYSHSGSDDHENGVQDEESDQSGGIAPDTSPDDSSVAPHATPIPARRSAGKRVVKPTFFERIAQEANGENGHSSPSVAGPSNSKKQPKISAVLSGNSQNPQAPSLRQPPDTPHSQQQPHELATGPFSDFELRNITEAVERWRDDHGLTQTQVNELIQGNPKEVKSQEFWASIIPTCPNRKRQKVINICRRKFHNFVARGTWSPEQHDELKRLWDIHGNKYTLIGKIINRHAEDIRDRVRNYVVCGESRLVQPWDPKEEEKLASIVADALEVIRAQRENGNDWGGQSDEDMIDWQRVSELMNRTRSRLQCLQKWKLMVRQKQAVSGSIDGGAALSVDEIITKSRDEAEAMTSHDRYKLIKAIRSYKSRADSRIPWIKIREKQMRRQWTRPTLMLAWYRLKRSVTDWNVMSLPEIAKQLSKRYHETEELPFPDGEGYDTAAEYAEIESKIQKILKQQTKRATVESSGGEDDDDEAHDQQSEGDSEDDGSDDDRPDDVDTSMEDGVEEESNHSVSESSASPGPSIPDLRPTKNPPPKQTPAKRTPVKRRAKPIPEQSSEEDRIREDDEVSSDTNASDASSIPARL